MTTHDTISDPTRPCTAVTLQEIGHGITRALSQNFAPAGWSPPEWTLYQLLEIALQEPLSTGEIEILPHHRIVLPTDPAREVVLDFLLRRRSGAEAAIDIHGWRWHRRDLAELTTEIQRERTIRRTYPYVIYTADELRTDAWGVTADLISRLDQGWCGEPLSISAGVRQIITACAHVPGAEQRPDRGATAPPRSALDHLRDVASHLPPPLLTADAAELALRRDYPRAYALWGNAEVEALRSAFQAHEEVTDIATVLGRSVSAVWAQLSRMGLLPEG